MPYKYSKYRLYTTTGITCDTGLTCDTRTDDVRDTLTNSHLLVPSPTLKLSSGSQLSPHPMLEKLALPSAILICQQGPSNAGKCSTFQRGTSILALSKNHGHSVIWSQKHSISGIRCFPTILRHLLEQENQSFT
jgi:hypothetical protein